MNPRAPWWSAVVAVASLTLACGNHAAGTGGSGTGGTSVASTSGPSTSSSKAATSSASGTSTSAGTGGAPVCNPPAAPGSLYAQSAVTTALDTISMCQYRGDVLLIVDTAGA